MKTDAADSERLEGQNGKGIRLAQEIMGIVLLVMLTLLNMPQAQSVFSGNSGMESGGQRQTHTVVLDSGHGGFDPGKIGTGGQLEKEINLKIAKRVRYYLEQGGIQVIMTRETDDGLYKPGDNHKKSADMQARIRLINEAKPDVMVSIHQNSYHQPEIHGAQVFYYRNSAEGKRFAELMQKRFDSVLGTENKRQARANGNYYLLTHAKPVSIIVEAGFLSNPKEAENLSEAEYQDRVAWTISVGIQMFLNERGREVPTTAKPALL